MEKRCPDCGELKPADQWGRNKRTKTGLAAYCKACTSVRNRAQYIANQERRKAEAKEYRQSNAEVLRQRDRERWQQRKGRQSEYRRSNRSQINVARRAWAARRKNYFRQWRISNPDRVTYEKAWHAANWDRMLELTRARRARDPYPFARAKHAYRGRLRTAPSWPYTADELRQKFEYHGGRCWMCRKPLLPGFHWDHVKPLNQGGSDMLANLRPACGPCNSAKRDRWPFAPALSRN